MNEMEEKLGTILGNPQLMQQIMSMAQSMSQTPQQTDQSHESPPSQSRMDPGFLQNISSLAAQSGIDSQQRALLHALRPYLSRHRVEKLEKAMRAAKMARMASGFLSQGGLSLLTGR